MQLRPYQQQLISDTVQSIRQGYKAPLVQSPTGSGKTVIFSFIAQGAVKKGNRVLILTHRREILQQTVDKLNAFGIHPGTITAGQPITDNPVQVAMIGTIARKLGSLTPPDLIIIDECQHAIAPSWSKVINYFTCIKIGFTATPELLSGEGLNKIFDTLITGPSTRQLVETGYLSNPRIFCGPDSDIKIKITKGDYDKEQQTAVYTRPTIIGSVLEHYKQYLDGKPVVCFCASIKHCHFMEDVFIQAGYRAATIKGGMSKTDRDNLITGLKDGSLQVLCSCDVISEGVDIPVIAGVILLRKTQSLALYFQQVGRALRVYPGKTEAIILDHVGNVRIHGHALADREWSLAAKCRAKRQAVTMPVISVCPACTAVWEGTPLLCPDCGYNLQEDRDRKEGRKPPREIEGILREVMPGQDVSLLLDRVLKLQALDKGKRQKAMLSELYRRGDCMEIRAMARALDYKQGWVEAVRKRLR